MARRISAATERTLLGVVKCDETIKPALFGAGFSDVDIEIAERVGLELTPVRLKPGIKRREVA